jgi:hypothetical protein
MFARVGGIPAVRRSTASVSAFAPGLPRPQTRKLASLVFIMGNRMFGITTAGSRISLPRAAFRRRFRQLNYVDVVHDEKAQEKMRTLRYGFQATR